MINDDDDSNPIQILNNVIKSNIMLDLVVRFPSNLILLARKKVKYSHIENHKREKSEI